MRTVLTLTLFCLATLASGCSSEQIYAGLQAGQRNQCLQYADDQRDRCLAAADASYQDYERQRTTP